MSTPPPQTYFTSDPHAGHRHVASLRGFASPELHDAFLAAQWWGRVRPVDRVFILGDIVASNSKKATEHGLSFFAKLPGAKHLISGNHDAVHPMNRDAHRRMRDYLDVFESVASAGRLRIEGQEVLLSHFPYERDRETPRHTQWRLRNEGKWLLHGHTHGTERVTNTGGVREVHVGVDAWGLAPVPASEIARLIAAEPAQ